VTGDRIGEARDLLAPIYQRSTEGFGTADLRAAKKLLDELNSPHPLVVVPFDAPVTRGARGYKNKLGNNPMRRPTKGMSE
jgi:hypothetical protein